MLSFIRRGSDFTVAAPFGRRLEEGMGAAGVECVENCLTGALAFEIPNWNSKPCS